jgi:hypothetical protein
VTDKLVLESDRANNLVNGVLDDEYEFVDSEYAGLWRWGVMYEVIIKDKLTGKLWGVTYQEQIGDHYYNSLDDGNVHFYPVEGFERTVTEYRRMRH